MAHFKIHLPPSKKHSHSFQSVAISQPLVSLMQACTLSSLCKRLLNYTHLSERKVKITDYTLLQKDWKRQ